MTEYVDLHVLPRVDDEKSCRQMAVVLSTAGYRYIGLALPSGLMQYRVSSLRNIFSEVGIETALRIDLAPTSRRELLWLLRRFRSAYDIISVKCVNETVAGVACRDRRVDIVFFDSHNRRVRFNHSFANLLRGALEFNLISAFLKERNDDVFIRIAHETAVAREHKVAVVLSSGCESAMMVRTPLQLAGIGTVMGLSREQSLSGVSDAPRLILTRNQCRRSKEYVEEGVRIVQPKAS